MKVILLKDVKALGKKGDIVEVSNGYARNSLLPKKFAAELSSDNLNDLKLQKQNDEKVAAEKLANANEMAKRLEGITINTSLKIGDGGRSFGSIASKELSELLKKQQGIDIDKKKIVLKDPIKAVGEYKIEVKLHPEVVGILNVNVSEEK